MSTKKKAIITVSVLVSIVVLIVLIVFLTQNLTSGNDENSEITERSYAVEILTTESESYDKFLNYTALIQPKTIELVTFTAINTVKKIHVKAGDTVSVGQVLVELDETQATQLKDVAYNEMIAAQNAMNVAKLNYDTALDSYNQSLGGQDTAVSKDDVKAQLDTAIQNRDNISTELNAINSALAPYELARDNANADLILAQNAYNEATAAVNADPTNQTLLDNQAAALVELNQKSAAFEQAQSNLESQENLLGKSSKEAQLQTAQSAVDALQLTYDNLEENPIMDSDVLYTQSEAARLTYEASKATYEALQTTYETSLENLNDLTYTSPINGTVLQVLSTEGSVVTPLAPVMALGTDEKIAQFGISSDDALNVKVGTRAKLTIKGDTYSGEVLAVATLPDEMTRTYLTDVSIDNAPDGLLLGEIVSVNINLGQTPGIWLPINIVLNDGEDYVFVVENGRASRKNIKILELNDDRVLVSGIDEGEAVVSQGMKTLKSGYKVSVVN